jgi:1,4-alpha-glucan branching enzyme
MPGDGWQKFANLRLLYGYMYAQPGKKLLFMGGEFAQGREWNHDASLDWHLMGHPLHEGVRRWVEDLNRVYRREAALHQVDFHPEGFEWIDCADADAGTLSFLRRGKSPYDVVVAVFNFTPVPRIGYRIGVPEAGYWRELLNSDARLYGGSGMGNAGGVQAEPTRWHGRPYSLHLTLPPLGVLFLRPG